MCTYNAQTYPCFYPTQYIKSKFSQSNITHFFNILVKVDDISDLAILSSQLCFGFLPPDYLRRTFCCFSAQCLKKCYNIVDDVQMLD
jgi:hypothetical protein